LSGLYWVCQISGHIGLLMSVLGSWDTQQNAHGLSATHWCIQTCIIYIIYSCNQIFFLWNWRHFK
jgi:hypothetical protein